MSNFIRRLFLSDKPCSTKLLNPAEQLCHDIQDDYYKMDTESRYIHFSNNKGFLEKNFALNREGVKVVSSKESNQGFKLNIVECISNKSVFNIDLFYGVVRDDPSKTVLYINSFTRETDEIYGFGRIMATLLKHFAEDRKFDFIWLHPVACKDSVQNGMNQIQLEQFYKDVFDSDMFVYEEVENVDRIRFVEYQIP